MCNRSGPAPAGPLALETCVVLALAPERSGPQFTLALGVTARLFRLEAEKPSHLLSRALSVDMAHLAALRN